MKVLIVGDFYPNYRLVELLKTDPNDILGNLIPIINNVDLAIVNLESPLTKSFKKISKTGPHLKADPFYANFLKKSGFSLVTLANNHILDYSDEGLKETLKTLSDNNLNWVGAGLSLDEASIPFYFSSKNNSLTVLNFAENEWSTTRNGLPGAAGINPISNFYKIKEEKKKSNFVIVITHGGHENYNLPSIEFRNLLRFYIDAGADAVINHHPHCVSGYEIYQKKPIFYSLGNFLFDRKDSRSNGEWDKGLALILDFQKDKIEFNILPFNQGGTNNFFSLLEGDEKNKFQHRIEDLNLIIQNDQFLIDNFKAWSKKSKLYYNINIEPHSYKLIQFLQNRGLLPTLWSDKKKLYLLNMLKSESHRELLIELLEDEISNT